MEVDLKQYAPLIVTVITMLAGGGTLGMMQNNNSNSHIEVSGSIQTYIAEQGLELHKQQLTIQDLNRRLKILEEK